eukprot:CAMPEP_0171326026 /NCGR_PEP_ID=MMETSP0816-20121228/117184_1 /TAXON_ID=420281 /ORGANISM="Proboscia inermis, Strain CCAP1064/1" /LENGTH=149 /DNA_ID=CAMNT_0011825363 /DNA_START=1484 /DNA_END=1933 /DNA_ORIENTATION=-
MCLDGINTTYKQFGDCNYETESTSFTSLQLAKIPLPVDDAKRVSSFGLACSDTGQYDLAIQFFERVVRILKREQMFQNDLDLDIANVYSFKPTAHFVLQDWDAAIFSCKEVVDIRLDVLEEEYPRVVGALENLCSAMKQSDVLKRLLLD